MLLGFLPGCSWFAAKKPANPISDSKITSSIPFDVDGPESFSAFVFVRTYSKNTTSERRYFVARDSNNSFDRFGIGDSGEFAVLRKTSGEVFRLDPSAKTYQKLPRLASGIQETSLISSLNSRWLNEKRSVTFTDLGLENGLRKFKTNIDGSRDTEILIFVDTDLKLPVRQEFYSLKGEIRTKLFSIELQDIKIPPDDALFVLPEDYSEVE